MAHKINENKNVAVFYGNVFRINDLSPSDNNLIKPYHLTKNKFVTNLRFIKS